MSLLSTIESVRNPTVEAPAVVGTREDPDKLRRAFELKLKGVPIKNIAATFSVADATIYRWLKEYREEFAREFHDRPRSDLLLDSLAFLRTLRDVAMKEVHQIDLDCVEVDHTGKAVKRGKPDRIAKFRMLTLAMNAETQSTNMLVKTGVLPNAVKEIHHSVDDTKPTDELTAGAAPATREEAIKKLTDFLVHERRMPSLDDEDE